MNRIKTLIVDDEPVARARIRRLLAEFSEIEIVGECADGFTAVSAILELAPDLLFLDIQMPGKTGFCVLEEIPEKSVPVTIFITAYDQYALQAFEVSALDYLLKPFEKSRFEQAVERAKLQITRVRANENARSSSSFASMLPIPVSKTDYPERLIIKTGGRVLFIKIDEIECMKAYGNYVRIYHKNAKYLLPQTLGNIERQLDPKKFLRIHRSSIVNIEYIKEMQQLFHGHQQIVLNSGIQLPVSRRYQHRLRKTFEFPKTTE